jgi:dTDP-4-amino-4,6-dideoxygalactose transaminase
MAPSGNDRRNARFGARAFEPSTADLPSVFPRTMGPNALRYLQEVVDAGLASDMVERFERYLADLHGVRFCVGTPGCTQAVFAAMLGMDFEPGDEIIVSPIADYGTVAGLLFENYIPVFADTDPGTALISAATIEPLITDRTRAILCVHMLGLPCDMGPIMALAERHGLLVIEDVCQAILSRYHSRLAGALGHLSCFSFDSEKTCGGDIGGAVLTDDEDLYRRICNRAIARGGVEQPGFGRAHTYRGFAARIPQCTAATCLANLEILPEQVEQRQRMAVLLDSLLAEIPGIVPYEVPEGRTHTYWMYGFSVDLARFSCSPADFARQIKEAGLQNAGLGRYYLMPAALTFLAENVARGMYPFSVPPASRRYDYSAASVPNARAFLETWIRWVWTEKYTEAHVELMAAIIRGVADANRRA